MIINHLPLKVNAANGIIPAMENKDLFALSRYDYALPPELIAQKPVAPRDCSRLLVLDRKANTLADKKFSDILGFLKKGDVLVLNDTRVINARLFAHRPSGGTLEVFLLREQALGRWEALVNPARRARVGEVINFNQGFTAKITAKTVDGGRVLEFSPKNIKENLDNLGEVPLPRYIRQKISNTTDYQTVYAQKQGAVAAPTAGLHFTRALLNKIQAQGVKLVYLTLHCGLATFRPVKDQDVRQHPMTAEWVQITQTAADTINKARGAGSRVIAVGTTSLRSLEAAAGKTGKIQALQGQTNIYIYPGYRFRCVDGLITNFHTPCSTNLILVSAFAGYRFTRKAYRYAIKAKFRFFSFGDAMLIV